MSVAAEAAVRAWINGNTALTDGHGGGLLARGAYLQSQRSPADGAYAVLGRIQSEGSGGIFAEDDSVTVARILAEVYAGTQQAAEVAAAALASAENSLTGRPVVVTVPDGGGDVKVFATANVVGPTYQPQPADSGEQFCFTVAADFILAAG